MKRILAAAIILAIGIVSLPLAALPFDGEGSENWILPLQLVGMALVGVAVSLAVPELAGVPSGRGRRIGVGIAAGLAAALVGVVIFWLLLNGFDGA